MLTNTNLKLNMEKLRFQHSYSDFRKTIEIKDGLTAFSRRFGRLLTEFRQLHGCERREF